MSLSEFRRLSEFTRLYPTEYELLQWGFYCYTQIYHLIPRDEHESQLLMLCVPVNICQSRRDRSLITGDRF